MHEQKHKVTLHSPLAELMTGFLREKQACGYRYERESHELLRLERFLCGSELKIAGLPRDLVDEWTAKHAHEKPGTQKLRVIRIRQFALFLRQQGIETYVPEATRTPVNRIEFTPHIFRREEIEKILQAVDRMPPDTRAPMRHRIMPEIFRLLYCCGMRVSEVVQLKERYVEWLGRVQSNSGHFCCALAIITDGTYCSYHVVWIPKCRRYLSQTALSRRGSTAMSLHSFHGWE